MRDCISSKAQWIAVLGEGYHWVGIEKRKGIKNELMRDQEMWRFNHWYSNKQVFMRPLERDPDSPVASAGSCMLVRVAPPELEGRALLQFKAVPCHEASSWTAVCIRPTCPADMVGLAEELLGGGADAEAKLRAEIGHPTDGFQIAHPTERGTFKLLLSTSFFALPLSRKVLVVHQP